MASIASVVTRGFGSWGSGSLVVTRGYGIGESVAEPDIASISGCVVIYATVAGCVESTPTLDGRVRSFPTIAGSVEIDP